jgi:chemotaxis protein MotA
MNFSSFIGFVAAITVFTLALFTSAKSYSIFLDTHALLIVVGGTFAVSCICFPLPKVMSLVRIFFKRIMGKNRRDYLGLIDEIVTLSAANRRGRAAFEAAVTHVRDPFLKDGAEVLFWMDAEISIDELRSLLETRAETHFERYLAEAEIFRVMARFPPAFGLLGTTLGMISLLQSLGHSDSRSYIGPSMSIALVATLYGIVMANFIFIPIGENLMQQTKEDLVCRRIVVEGIMLIAGDKPTQFVEEKVKSFLLPGERGGRGVNRPQRRAGGGQGEKDAA